MSSPSRSPGQLSMLEYLRGTSSAKSDEELIRALAERLLDDADVRPPVNVEILASMRGISEIGVADQPWAGMLLSEEGRLVVRVRGADSWPRQRFSVLHEAIHTCLPGFRETQFRCNPSRSGDRLEALCDLGASELLLPRRYFAPDLGSANLDLDVVIELADRYEASLEATAIRAVDLWPGPASLLVFRRQTKPSEASNPHAEPRLRLAWSHASGGWPYLPRYKSTPEDSPFGRALAGEVVSGVFPLAELTLDSEKLYRVSARALGDDRVLALLRSHADEEAA